MRSQYVETIATVDGHTLALFVCRVDEQYKGLRFDADNVIVLPPSYIMRGLYNGFLEREGYDTFSRSLNTFRIKLITELSHICVSLRTRGYVMSFLFIREIPQNVCTKPFLDG